MSPERRKEQESLTKQINELSGKLRQMDVEDNKEYIRVEQEKFEKIKGKSFISVGSAHDRSNVVHLIKVLSCDQFQQYGLANVFQVTMYFGSQIEKISRIEFGYGTHRRDSFDGKEKESELTAERLEELRSKVSLNINEIFDTFKTITHELT